MSLYTRLRTAAAKAYSALQSIHSQLSCVGYRIWSAPVIMEVGANTGSSYAALVKLMPAAKFYGFEPTPELADQIEKRFSACRNYFLTRKAVGETPGFTRFNVADRNHGGCSSLLEFAENVQNTWKGRDDLVVTRTIEVEVIRLDTFVQEKKLTQIDFLHVDTQGTDIAVLKSLGDSLALVKKGVIEVPQSRDVMLYKNQHTREEAIEFLEGNGFRIYKTESQQNEDNLYFCRR
jgi:FkbM family methyltransferase